MEDSAGDSFYERLEAIGLTAPICRTFDTRRSQSVMRLEELARRLRQTDSIEEYQGLGIYAAGSHARGDASQFSDIDLWFMHNDTIQVESPNIKTIRVMSAIIEQMKQMEFPAPSNDGEFLKILPLSDILNHLGGPQDDYKNHFTARMLLLLESRPIYGTPVFNVVIEAVVDSYLCDYEDHAAEFRPTFLVNDILRYWKTLCLNYEHRRNKPKDADRIKQKIKNFKLGYSRLLTCFATIALLSGYNNINKDELIAICKLNPIDRLLLLVDKHPSTKTLVMGALTLYHWFLEKTEMSSMDLETYFSEKDNRVAAFGQARQFGDQVFQIVKLTAEETGTFRYLVV
jgi:hypothetical protein